MDFALWVGKKSFDIWLKKIGDYGHGFCGELIEGRRVFEESGVLVRCEDT